MKLIDAVRAFLHKARQEARKEYSVPAANSEVEVSSDARGTPAAKRGWIGVDLDGTLAHADTLSGTSKIGAPIPRMVALARKLGQEGYRIKIFTARASDARQVVLIREWLRENGLPDFEITNAKDFEMIRLYDDRAVQVIVNTGELVERAPLE